MRFGFIVHPLRRRQQALLGVRSADPSLMLLGHSARRPARLISKLSLRDPHQHHTTGWLVATPQLTESMLIDQASAVEEILDAARFCQARGAEIVGLGAVAAVVGGQGKAVAREAGVRITTGNALTAIAATQTLALWGRLSGRRRAVELLGPPGAVSEAILALLIAEGARVAVVSAAPPKPLKRKLERLNAEGLGRAHFIDAPTLGPDHVLIAASSTGGRLRQSALPPGSVVIDVAAPLDVIRDAPRADVLVLDGEHIRLPAPLGGSHWRRVYGLVTGQDRHIFACFAEPMLLALSGRLDLASVGRDIPLERLQALYDLSIKHGFWVDQLYEAGRPLRGARARRFLSSRGVALEAQEQG